METRFIFFSGKGGVGKTSMASSCAVYSAQKGQKTLIVTTDPASNLGDVFEQEIGHKITPILGIDNLYAMEIDPDAATSDYKERTLAPLRQLLPPESLAVIEEQLDSPCTTEMAAFERFVDFLEHPNFQVVIFDTAPTGHTLRLLELPLAWSRQIEEVAEAGGTTCVGPPQALQESKEKFDRAIKVMRDPRQTTFIFVTLPSKMAIAETVRSSEELRKLGFAHQELIVNQVLPQEHCQHPFFQRRYQQQEAARVEISHRLSMPTIEMPLLDKEIKGLASLKETGEQLYGQQRSRILASAI